MRHGAHTIDGRARVVFPVLGEDAGAARRALTAHACTGFVLSMLLGAQHWLLRDGVRECTSSVNGHTSNSMHDSRAHIVSKGRELVNRAGKVLSVSRMTESVEMSCVPNTRAGFTGSSIDQFRESASDFLIGLAGAGQNS